MGEPRCGAFSSHVGTAAAAPLCLELVTPLGGSSELFWVVISLCGDMAEAFAR